MVNKAIERKQLGEGQATYQASVQEQNLNTRFALRNRDGSCCALPNKTRHEEPMEVNKFVGKC